MKHDSAEWREYRDAALRFLLADEQAVEFFIRLSNFVEVIDDLVDKDKVVVQAELFDAIQFVLCDMPFNSFYKAYDRELRGQLSMALNGWFESERLKKTGDVTSLAYAFVLRDQLDEMLFTAVSWLRGYEFVSANAELIRSITTNDSFESYMEENKK